MIHTNQKIRHSFSKVANKYDNGAQIHRELGLKLLNKIGSDSHPHNILDIGMGTGFLTRAVVDKFSGANVVGIDFADGMLTFAKKQNHVKHIVQADTCALPFKENLFDLIVSNASLHWANDLKMAFKSLHKILKPKGKLCLNLFGHNTFKEVFESLQRVAGLNNKFVERLPDEEAIKKAVQSAGFKQVLITREQGKVYFSDMLSIIKWTKDIGANTLKKNVYIGRGMLLKANKYYKETFSDRFGTYATLEIIWIEASK